MSLMSWIFFCLVLFLPYGVRGTLMPSGTVAVNCSGQQTFTCDVTGVTTDPAAGWIIMGLFNISASGSNGVVTANRNPRITGTGGNVPTSTITIADFTMSDNGGTVKCINTEDDSDQGTATISVEPLPPPSNTTATTVGHDCTVITLQWDEPDTPSDITSTVNCTSADCSACTSSPCNITDLELSTDYNFTVILNSGMCGTSVDATTARTLEPLSPPSNVTTTVGHDCTVITLQWDTPDTPSDITSAVNCTSPSTACNASCTSSPCDITGLALNTEYTFTVTLNSGMCGTSMSTTTATTMGVPPPLVNVSAQLIEDTSVRITWDQPSNNPPVTSVTVTCMPSSTNCETCPPSGPCTIRGLASNTTYVITVTPKNKCGDGSARSVNVTTNFTASPPPTNPGIPIVAIVVPIVAAIILVVLVVIIVIVVVIWCMKKKHSVKDNSSARMSRLRSNEERANLGEDTYASPGTEKPQPETTDGVYSYAATETKIGAQMKEREQQKKQPPPQGDFYEEPNAAKNVQHKTGTITGETYAQPDKPKRGTKKKDKQQKEPVPHKETPAGELYAMPDKKKDVSHTSGPVTGDEYAVASKPKTGGGYGAHGPQ